jgi:peptidyl-prolyl cis-trans isomerase SurA
MAPMTLVALLMVLQITPSNGNGEDHRTGIAARINGEVITWDEVEERMRAFPAEERTEEFRRNELRRLAEDRLWLQFARQYQIRVTEQQVDEAIKRDRKQIGEHQWENFLAGRKQTMSQYRDNLRKELIRRTLERRLASEAYRNPNFHTTLLYESVTPKELREWYLQNKERYGRVNYVSMWRIALKFATEEEKVAQRKVAESILRKLKEGNDFFLMAIHYSEVSLGEPGKKQPRYAELKRADSPFSEATTKYLFETIEEGTVSDIVEDGNSWNIFRVERRVDRPEESFEEAQLKIRAEIEGQKREENNNVLKQQLVRRSFIEPQDLFRQQ